MWLGLDAASQSGRGVSRPWSVTFLKGRHGPERTLAEFDLPALVERVAARLAGAGVTRGDRVALALPTGPDLVAAIFAVWRCGATFSVFPSVEGPADAAARDRLASAVRVLSPRLVVKQGEWSPPGAALSVTWQQLLEVDEGPVPAETPSPSDVAVIQFTSGSTGASARGVQITHAQLEHNLQGIAERIAIRADDAMVSWAPLYHDMGLIALLLPARFGLPVALIPTETFGRRPSIWLEAISRFRGTLSPGPAFAFGLLGRRPGVTPEDRIDLSSWRYAWVGAETIFAEQIAAFERAFASFGLAPDVVQPTYGLAESVVAVSSGAAGAARRTILVDGAALRLEGKVIRRESRTPGSLELMMCGKPIRGLEIRIAGPDGEPLGELCPGRIMIRGPSVTPGYVGERARNPDDWLFTGDLGFLAEGEIVVSGREKELIKRGGVGIAPQDIEWVVERSLGLRTGRAVAFSFPDGERAQESVVILVEAPQAREAHQVVMERLVASVAAEVGVQVDHVQFVGRNAIPRTSSGKLQRGRARDRFLAGSYMVSNEEPA
jgi:fatty-acyl-CoA synthase